MGSQVFSRYVLGASAALFLQTVHRDDAARRPVVVSKTGVQNTLSEALCDGKLI